MDANESLAYLNAQAERLCLTELCFPVLKDPRFPIWSGASKPFQHHYGDGGLVKHVAEVVQLCFLNNDALGKPIDEKKLFLAALFHDAGKMWDYRQEYNLLNSASGEYDLHTWGAAPHKRNIHHITRSALVWQSAWARLFGSGFNSDDFDEVLHAIISHHGAREYRSPVMPNSRLAWMVHLCDGISARMNDAETWDHVHQK